MIKEAVRRVQEYCGLEPTGVIDRDTLIAIYYNQDAVDYLQEYYPETEAAETAEE